MKSYMDIWLRTSSQKRLMLDILEFGILLGVGLLFPTPKISSSILVKSIGIIFILIGLWLHRISHTIHKQAHQPKEKIKKIISNGIYSKIRHPCYLEIVLYYFGLFFLIGSLTMLLPIFLFMFILYHSIIHEEKYLREKLGEEYKNYMKKVPWRFIPKLF